MDKTDREKKFRMKKIVIIGANDFQNPLIEKAKEMGLETHVFAWQDGSIGEQTADYFYPISIAEKEEILEKCKEIQPDAVATIASDLANITVNYLARNLGLISNSANSIIVSTNKYQMRDAFAKHGVKTPGFMKVTKETNLEGVKKTLRLPVIVKPTDRSGSRGITKLNSFNELQEAVESSFEDSFEKAAIVEEYIEGNEYSCECISYNGEHHLLAMTQKYTTGYPHFIETGHMEPTELSDEVIENAKMEIFKALDALEIQNSASHSELKVDKNGNIGIIEIGSRMGGDCIGSDLVRISTGYDFVRMVIEVALGQEPDFTLVCNPKVGVTKFIFSQEDYNHFVAVKEQYPEKIFYHSEMYVEEDCTITDSSSRYGFYIMQCDNRDEAKELAAL